MRRARTKTIIREKTTMIGSEVARSVAYMGMVQPSKVRVWSMITFAQPNESNVVTP